MTFKFRTFRQPVHEGLPSLPRISGTDKPEQLLGVVQDMQASAPEERFARALEDLDLQYVFRYTSGAPKGLPGWKELDFIVVTNGLVYLVEVDTAFTHRGKEAKDVLHDAILMNDTEIQMMGEVWPTVIHADGDGELASQDTASAYVKRMFGR